MLAFSCARPPTKSWAQASQSDNELCSYLLSSGDPTDAFLKTALAMVRETAAFWAVAQSNSTSSCRSKVIGARTCAALERLLVSLSQSPGGANKEDASAEVAPFLRFSVGGSRLEKVVKEVGQRDSAKHSEATASSGGKVIVS
jgi:hypothetical protein